MRAKYPGLLALLIAVMLAPWSWGAESRAQTAANARVVIEAIVRAGCQHCQAEEAFLEELRKTQPNLEIRLYDIATPEGSALFKAVVPAAKLSWTLPITIVGGDVLQGFDSPETTGKQIEDLLARNRGGGQQGFAALLSAARTAATPNRASADTFYVRIPGFGALNAAGWPLPVIAVVLGFLDGFNPCAMWVLVTFLLVLIQIGSRRRMWAVAGLFIVAETVMYFLILNLWFQFWDFVGMDRIVTPLVGIVAIGGGLFFLYESFKAFGSELACRIVDMEERSRIVRHIKSIGTDDFGIITALSIIALAFSVNVIEFACSIGYPQAFTKIIELNNLNFWATETLISIYTLFYMADDFLVFGLALWGFDQLQLGQRYARWTLLLGGMLMLAIGLLMIFHPQTLRVT